MVEVKDIDVRKMTNEEGMNKSSAAENLRRSHQENRLAKLDSVPTLDKNLFDGARGASVDLVKDLHGFNETDHGIGSNACANADKWRLVRRGRCVERSNHWAFNLDQTSRVINWGGWLAWRRWSSGLSNGWMRHGDCLRQTCGSLHNLGRAVSIGSTNGDLLIFVAKIKLQQLVGGHEANEFFQFSYVNHWLECPSNYKYV